MTIITRIKNMSEKLQERVQLYLTKLNEALQQAGFDLSGPVDETDPHAEQEKIEPY